MWVLLSAIVVLILLAILLEVIEKKGKPKREQGRVSASQILHNEASDFWFLTNETVAKWISVAAEYCRVSIVEEREKAHTFSILAERDCFVFGIGLSETSGRRKKTAEGSRRREILRYRFADYGMPVLTVGKRGDERASFARWAADLVRELLQKNGVLVAVEYGLRYPGECGEEAVFGGAQSGSVCHVAYVPKSV